MKTKRCNNCKEIKPVSEFNKDKKAKDKLYRWCKNCQSKDKKISKRR